MKTLGENNLLQFHAWVLQAIFDKIDCMKLLNDFKENNVHISQQVFEDIESSDRSVKTRALRLLLEDSIESCFFRQELENYIICFLTDYSEGRRSVFDIICDFAKKMIVRSENSFCYRYEYTQIWRDYTRSFDEEIVLVAAAMNDRRERKLKYPLLDFSYCITCDCADIRRLVRRDEGTSENHFHMRGSSPYYSISWIYLMNHVDYYQFEERINWIETEPLVDGKSSIRGHMAELWRKAAAIRLYLYCFCQERDGFVVFSRNDSAQDDFSVMDELLGYIYSGHFSNWYSNEDSRLQRIIELCYQCTQYNIKSKSSLEDDFDHEVTAIDYAQFHRNLFDSSCPDLYHRKYLNLLGERNFLYLAMDFVMNGGEKSTRFADLFYLYLTIKHQFYIELVQCNKRIGFYNFLEYQNRKDFFIPWSYVNEMAMATDTICSIIDDIKIHKVELRITPEEDLVSMWKIIRTYDSAIKEALNRFPNTEVKLKNFFYTLQFIKYRDTAVELESDFVQRNNKSRRKAMRQAQAIIATCQSEWKTEINCTNTKFDDNEINLLLSQRIYGIDACTEEMDCRPEVFGTVFRLLQHYFPVNFDHHIKATYHVGEDNYDIVDALRAIDEAIMFCDFRSGNRLGHATLLGISARQYYNWKKSNVSMPKQNWLDNVVWLYYFIKNNNITFDGCSLLLNYLSHEFYEVFTDIYGYELASPILEETFREHEVLYPNFDMKTYYLSWWLRGDEPELYLSGFLDNLFELNDSYLLGQSSEKMKEARTSKEACYLYYLYHFRGSVKAKGNQIVFRSLPKYFINGVGMVQEKMRQLIAEMGIGIETNPTSNLFISPIHSYTEHPLSVFYDNGLKKDMGHVQLNISVNTDDKSVFSTNLSNEYSFLLWFYEQMKDEEGNSLFSRFQILNWLDDIRKMGNEQSFYN